MDRGSVNSRHKVLHPKDSLVIRFDECGTCGYHWSQVTKASGKVITTKGVAKGPDNAPGVVGGVGTHTYTFTAKAVGSTTAKLGYFAPGASKPERVVTIALTVTKQSS